EAEYHPLLIAIRWFSGGTDVGCVTHASSPGSHPVGTGFDVVPGAPCAVTTLAARAGSSVSESRTIYISNISIEWHASAVPLTDMNPGVVRSPMRVDPIPGTYSLDTD